jgi:hypothetical protein
MTMTTITQTLLLLRSMGTNVVVGVEVVVALYFVA